MGKLNKEEVILLFLDNPDKLSCAIADRNVEVSEEILKTICEFRDPRLAYWYYVDNFSKEGCQMVKEVCCTKPVWAYSYARWIQKVPCATTRTAACGSSTAARWYAKEVDREPREETRKAAYSDYFEKGEYEQWENSRKKK